MSVPDNFTFIQKQIAKTAQKAGRLPDAVRLVAVSKNQPDEKIQAALDLGHRLFGENKVQEAAGHWQSRRADYPDLCLHLIGPLQTNKAKKAVALFDVIETLDRQKLADSLAREMDKQQKQVSCFIQVNTGEENQKSGVLPKDFRALHEYAVKSGIEVTGVMCIPPVNEPPSLHFALLTQIARDFDLNNISMGMSADFDKAILCGATHVRVGSALFGQR